jgi:hypothetical protein
MNMTPEARAVVLGTYRGDSVGIHKGGILARGFKSGKTCNPTAWELHVERVIQQELRKRGLIK